MSDLVLFGATGFTGALVAQALAERAPRSAAIVLAGRSQPKLERVRASLPPHARGWPLKVIDATDASALRALAEDTKAIVTTVGPYSTHGLPLVEACANAGTHYGDLAGETQFMRDSIDRYDARARQTGARIVHACGFDSIPSDLGVLELHTAKGKLKRVTAVIEAASGGFSGGTIASGIVGLDEAKASRERRKLMADPYGLSPNRAEEPSLGPEWDSWNAQNDAFTGQWLAPWIMAQINTRVVRRSNALQGYVYGRQFKYSEWIGAKTGVRGALVANAVALGMKALTGGLTFEPTRAVLQKFLPKPGEGPSEAARKNGKLRMRFVGETEAGERCGLLFKGRGDPGYQLTSVMFAEAALCLAFDELKTPGGVLTPATAMGRALTTRLRAAGVELQLL